MGKLSETMGFSQIHSKRDYGQTLARQWENLSETLGKPWLDDWKRKLIRGKYLVTDPRAFP